MPAVQGPFTMSQEAIEGALEAARSRLEQAEKGREELEHAIAATREEMRLLEQLLALRIQGMGGLSNKDNATEIARSRALGGKEQGKHQAVTAVIEELEAAGRPIHISELMRLLREKQVQIPGAGTQANLISHLRRDDRLVRPSRGIYGLAAWGLPSMISPARKWRRKKRMRSTGAENR